MEHILVMREITQSSQTHVISSLVDDEASTSGAHASLSSRRRHVSPTQEPEAQQVPETPQESDGFEGGSSDFRCCLYTRTMLPNLYGMRR